MEEGEQRVGRCIFCFDYIQRLLNHQSLANKVDRKQYEAVHVGELAMFPGSAKIFWLAEITLGLCMHRILLSLPCTCSSQVRRPGQLFMLQPLPAFSYHR